MVLKLLMDTKQSQIKINLPLKLKKIIKARAEEYDMTLAGYTKHLMIMDAKYGRIPVMEPSASTIKALKAALKEEKEGKLREIKDVDKYFTKLIK